MIQASPSALSLVRIPRIAIVAGHRDQARGRHVQFDAGKAHRSVDRHRPSGDLRGKRDHHALAVRAERRRSARDAMQAAIAVDDVGVDGDPAPVLAGRDSDPASRAP